jgi:hypothetical protein
MLSLDQFLRTTKDVYLFPAQLKKTMGKEEKACSLPIETQVLPRQVGDNKKMKACTSWRVANPYHVLQRLIDGCFVSGNYEDSEFGSKVKYAIVPVFGCDKGGNDTVMMLRVANRKDGNTKNCSQPLAAYEEGAENYWNLSKQFITKTHLLRNSSKSSWTTDCAQL